MHRTALAAALLFAATAVAAPPKPAEVAKRLVQSAGVGPGDVVRVAGHPALNAILQVSQTLFDRMTPAEPRPAAWHVELHQFRIEARPGEAGRPTPSRCIPSGVGHPASPGRASMRN